MAGLRTTKIHPDHPDVATFTNTVNVRSLLFRVTAPSNVFMSLASIFQAVIKLYSAANVQIPADSEFFVGKRRPGERAPRFTAGSFTNHDHYDLTTAQQRNVQNAATLRQDLGQGVRLRDGEMLEIYLDSSAVVNFAVAGSAFEFPMDWQQA